MMFDFRSIAFKDQFLSGAYSVLSLIKMGPLFPKVASERDAFEKKRDYVKSYINKNLSPFIPKALDREHSSFHAGIFNQLKFGSVVNLQAGIVQKLFGVYEIEIVPALQRLFTKKYDYAINIGAAEGLYSVLFEKSLANTPIYSFEQDYHTRMLLRQICSLNNCKNIFVLGTFSLDALENIPEEQKGFVFCDCEGFESQIFTSGTLAKFRNVDVLIETHDHIQPGVTERLKALLSKTHRVEEIQQINLQERRAKIADQEFNNLSENIQLELLNEDRHPLNRWIVAEAF